MMSPKQVQNAGVVVLGLALKLTAMALIGCLWLLTEIVGIAAKVCLWEIPTALGAKGFLKRRVFVIAAGFATEQQRARYFWPVTTMKGQADT